MFLALKRPQLQQAALDRLTHDQQVRGSATYHRWIRPTDLRSFGPAQADIDKVVSWLKIRNLTVNSVSPSGMAIDFGGTTANVAAAFYTRPHFVSPACVFNYVTAGDNVEAARRSIGSAVQSAGLVSIT